MEMAPHPPTVRHPKNLLSSLLASSTRRIQKLSANFKRDRSASGMRSDIISQPRSPNLRGGRSAMNQHIKPPTVSPLAVTDPKIRVMLQLAGLRFMITRANWLISEATILGKALKAGDDDLGRG